jgi:TIGR03009 family protein
MRYFGLALAGVLLTRAGGYAQAPQQPAAQPQAPQQQPAAPVLDPANNKLDALLLQWEQRMKGVQALTADCTRTKLLKTFRTTDVFEGQAKYLRPNLASLHLLKKNKPEIYERYICTGQFLYEFVPQNKQVRVHDLTSLKGQGTDENFLSFLFDMKAEEAKRRYQLTLVKGPPEDKWYYYVDMLPRYDQDKVDFTRARLVLLQSTFLPRQVWFEQPNGDEVTWDIPRIDPNAPVNRQEFEQPRLPSDWNLFRVPRSEAPRGNEPPPRIVRPEKP